MTDRFIYSGGKDPTYLRKPPKRNDGELYERPLTDSAEFLLGYEHGFEGQPERPIEGTLRERTDYQDGYDFGSDEKEGIGKSGSSNA